MKFKNSMMSIVVITSAMCLFNCKDKSSDPSPEAAFVNGGFTGTITGTRADGKTPINETFAYTYDAGGTGISQPANGVSSLTLSRWESMLGSYYTGTMNVPLSISAQNQVTLSSNNVGFSFSKQEPGATLFEINAQSLVQNQETYLLPVDPSNANYKFNFTFYAYSGSGYPNLDFSEVNDAIIFKTKLGEKVYFSDPFFNGDQDVNGDSYGKFLYVINSSGTKSTISTVYGSLMLREGTPPSANGNNKVDGYYFNVPSSTAGVYTDLSKTLVVPPDTYSLTNYTYDTTTGNMAFDYTFNFAGWPRSNSTGNPLTIKGSFKGKVSEVVN